MAHIKRSFSISDDDIMMDTPSLLPHGSTKGIALAVSLLVLGAIAILAGALMAYYRADGNRIHGILFAVLGTVLFIPGFYYTRIAYYACKGYTGFSLADIPAV